jgi:hypothetical protein
MAKKPKRGAASLSRTMRNRAATMAKQIRSKKGVKGTSTSAKRLKGDYKKAGYSDQKRGATKGMSAGELQYMVEKGYMTKKGGLTRAGKNLAAKGGG